MKKIVLSFCVSAFLMSSLSALDIDATAAKIDFFSYKTANKVKVPDNGIPGTFKNAKFSFTKTSGSVSDILKGAVVEFDLGQIDSGKNIMRDNNIKSKLFAFLTTQKVTGEITEVSGDDKTGLLKTKINFNGVEKDVPLTYKVSDGKLVATGEINLKNDFNAKEAFDKFANDKMIQGLHGKKTWSDVTVGFEVPIK